MFEAEKILLEQLQRLPKGFRLTRTFDPNAANPPIFSPNTRQLRRVWRRDRDVPSSWGGGGVCPHLQLRLHRLLSRQVLFPFHYPPFNPQTYLGSSVLRLSHLVDGVFALLLDRCFCCPVVVDAPFQLYPVSHCTA
jgi:hypothetical protein